ncbi:hypothetical protein [Streptomyces sp. KL116D]
MAVTVLQALARHGGAPGGAADHEAAAHPGPSAQNWSPVRWNPNIA